MVGVVLSHKRITMHVPFEQLSSKARLWIYQASRPLTGGEISTALQEGKVFLTQWASHGKPLQCGAVLEYDQFLILAVEERFQPASGCAVDASLQFVRGLGQKLGIDFLDRTQVAFKRHQGKAEERPVGEVEVLSFPLSQLKEKIAQGIVAPDMVTFDNTIATKGALDNSWQVRASDSWLGKYFEKG